jgi:hypothetical protein
MQKIQFRMGLYFEREFAWDEKRQQLAFVDQRLISLKREVGVHKTSFIQAFFYWTDCSQEKWAVVYIFAKRIDVASCCYLSIDCILEQCGIFCSFTFYLENRFGFQCTCLEYHVFELLLRNNVYHGIMLVFNII